MEKQPIINSYTRIILGILLFTIICCCVGVGYFGYLSYQSLLPLENAEIEINLPPVVTLGEDVDFTVTIINTSTESITLNSINIAEEIVNGIQIGDSIPIFELRDHYELIGIPMDMFLFNELILVDESLTIKFDSKAVKVGDFSGQMFICIDNTTNCEIKLLRTVVEEEILD